MSEQATPDFEALARRMDALASSVEELKKAKTAPERKEAREDVEEASAALRRYAESNGISLSDAEEAIAEVKRNNQKGMIREVLKELLADEADDLFGLPEGEAAETKAAPKTKPKPKTDPEPVTVPGDNPPAGEHWTDRRIG